MVEKRAYFMVLPSTPARGEAEWNEWLNKVHMPVRLAMPGFIAARRFIAIEGNRKYFHLFTLADAGVMRSEAYLKLREKELSAGDPSQPFMLRAGAAPGTYRGLYEQIFPENEAFTEPRSKVILVVGLDVPSEKEEEFNVWYNTEHIPGHLAVPGFLRAYRFRSLGGEISSGRKATGPQYIALYEVEDEKVFQTEAYARCRESPWTSWLRKFYIRRFRSIFRSIY